MSNREVIKSIGDILKNEMQLQDSQIMLAFEKYNIPETPGIFIALSYVSGKAIGNKSVFNPTTNIEEITTTLHQIIQVDIMSFDSSARTRMFEVLAALASVFSEQQQEKYNFQIGRIPGEFVNVSSLEETKYLNRFTISVAVTSLATLQRFPDYFADFSGEFVENSYKSPTSFNPEEDPIHA